MYTVMMQEYCQLHGLDLPVYKVYSEQEYGPDQSSRCLYTATATVNGMIFLAPWCESFKEARNGAAKSVFDFISTNGPTSLLTAPPPSPPSTSTPPGSGYHLLQVYPFQICRQDASAEAILQDSPRGRWIGSGFCVHCSFFAVFLITPESRVKHKKRLNSWQLVL